jgi:hypothetical protein
MVVPDPRAFALHKFWLSGQPDREPVKKQRDRDQGLAVVRLVAQYLPQYLFKKSELKMFPADVFNEAQKQISGKDGFSDFDIE